ncbi:MAG TPA: hypothetical protein VL400_25335 [Polyangiaceae bacterium]|nr:hypothetical protein [Polyangiaceae bacterium]
MNPRNARRLFPTLLLTLVATSALGGCAPSGPAALDDTPAQRGEAALDEGSCADACGGASDDGCWCDDLCIGYGDCCADYEATCVAPLVVDQPPVRILVPPKIAADAPASMLFVATLDPATSAEQFIVTVNRPSALTVTKRKVQGSGWGGHDGYNYPPLEVARLKPCASTEPDCLGPVQISVALESAPDEILATTTVEIVAPIEGPNSLRCQGAGSIAVYEGLANAGLSTIGEKTFVDRVGKSHVFTYFIRPAPGMPESGLRNYIFNPAHRFPVELTVPYTAPAEAGLAGSTWDFVHEGICPPVFVDYRIEELEVAPGYDINDPKQDPPLTKLTLSWRNTCHFGKLTFSQYGCVRYDANDPVLDQPPAP